MYGKCVVGAGSCVGGCAGMGGVTEGLQVCRQAFTRDEGGHLRGLSQISCLRSRIGFLTSSWNSEILSFEVQVGI